MSLDMQSLLGPLRGRRRYDISAKLAETHSRNDVQPFRD
jgi:hypothetical protein